VFTGDLDHLVESATRFEATLPE
jgi:hypothetical protein